MNWASLVLGIGIVVLTSASVVQTLVITRRSYSPISSYAAKVVRAPLVLLARWVRDYHTRDWIQVWIAPASILGMLSAWMICFLIGYGLLLHAGGGLTVSESYREAGSSLFTLGFASSHRPQLTLVDFLAAATGPIVIGLMVGYLPSLYGAYNRREVDVAMLHGRAGEPNWGPEILVRHALTGTRDQLNELWNSWERWAADISESHTTYSTLIYMRSARPQRNWLIALLAVMDSAALQISLAPHRPQGSARVLLRMGIETMHDLARACGPMLRQPLRPAGDDIELSYAEFAAAVEYLDQAGYSRQREPAEAWNQFRQWRRHYEAPAYALAERIDAVPALWSGPRRPATPQVPPVPARFVVAPDEGPRPVFTPPPDPRSGPGQPNPPAH